jgi:hypothetical protein
MKRIVVVGLLLGLLGCTPVRHVFYMVPQLEFADGEVPTMLSFPTASLAECQTLGSQFDSDVGTDPTVLSHAWTCVLGALQVKKPTMAVPEPLAPPKNST